MTTRKRKQIVSSLQDKESRDAFVEAHIETGVEYQIKANRLVRGWTQKQLGDRASMKQTAISRLEGPSEGLPKLATLTRLASAFDVALVVRFVPFSELVNWSVGLGERALEVPSFSDDAGLQEVEDMASTFRITNPAQGILHDVNLPRSEFTVRYSGLIEINQPVEQGMGMELSQTSYSTIHSGVPS